MQYTADPDTDLGLDDGLAVGRRIRAMRRRRGLSQAQLAHPELSDSYISLLESGKRTPTRAVLELLAAKLDCSLSYLVTGATEDQVGALESDVAHAQRLAEQGDLDQAHALYQKVLASPLTAVAPQAGWQAGIGMATVLRDRGDLEQAITVLQTLRTQRPQQLPPAEHAYAAQLLMQCWRLSGDADSAVAVADPLLASASVSQETAAIAGEAVAALIDRGDLLRAGQLSNELLAAAGPAEPPEIRVIAHRAAAEVAVARRARDAAIRHAEAALHAAAEDAVSRVRADLAVLLLPVAPQWAAHARTDLDHWLSCASVPPQQAARYATAALRLAVLRGEHGSARRYLAAAAALLDRLPPVLAAETYLAMAQALTTLTLPKGRKERAVEQLHRALDLLEQAPAGRRTATLYLAAGQLMEHLGMPGSTEMYRQALEHATV